MTDPLTAHRNNDASTYDKRMVPIAGTPDWEPADPGERDNAAQTRLPTCNITQEQHAAWCHEHAADLERWEAEALAAWRGECRSEEVV